MIIGVTGPSVGGKLVVDLYLKGSDRPVPGNKYLKGTGRPVPVNEHLASLGGPNLEAKFHRSEEVLKTSYLKATGKSILESQVFQNYRQTSLGGQSNPKATDGSSGDQVSHSYRQTSPGEQ